MNKTSAWQKLPLQKIRSNWHCSSDQEGQGDWWGWTAFCQWDGCASGVHICRAQMQKSVHGAGRRREGWAQLRMPTQLNPKTEVTVSYQHSSLCTWAPDEAGSELFSFFFFEVRISTRAETNREHKGCFKFGGKINELLCVWLLWSRAYSQTAWFQHVTRNGRPKEDACLRRSTLKVPLWKLTNAGDCCNLSTHQSAGDGLKHFENPLPKKKCLWLLWSEQTESMLLKSAQ